MDKFRRLHLGRTGLCACVLFLGSQVIQAGIPTITQQPTTQTVWVGMNVTLSTTAVGSPEPSFQWRLGNVAIAGATNSVLDLFCVSMAQSGGSYTLVASNSFGSVTSSPALLFVQVPDSGQAPYTWGVNSDVWNDQVAGWLFRGSPGSVVWVDVLDTSSGSAWGTDVYTDDSSFSAAAYHTGVLPKGQRGTIRVQFLGSQNSFSGSERYGVTSSGYGFWPGSFRVLGTAPTITRHPVSSVRMVGGIAEMRVEAFGTGKLQYQWKHNGAAISGATNSTLTFAVKSTASAGSYSVLVTDEVSTTLSQHAVFGVLPARIAHPQSYSMDASALAPGDFRHLIVTGVTNGSTRVWGNGFYSVDSDLAKAAVHAGLAKAGETRLITVVRLPQQSSFLSDSSAAMPTMAFNAPFGAVAFAGSAPIITRDPISQAVPIGESRRLEVGCSYPGSYTVQWRRNGQPIPGATSASYMMPPTVAGTIEIYDAVISSPGNAVPTWPAYIFPIPLNAIRYDAANAVDASAFLGAPNFLISAPVTGNISNGWVYGTGLYTSDSSLARTAVHSGRLEPGQQARIEMYSIGSWSNFVGTVRNGVESFNFGPMPGYVFVFSKSLPSSPVLTMTTPGVLKINGDVGCACQVWSSTSLNPGSWTPIASFTLTNSPQLWIDPSAGVAKRYYRVSVTP